MATVTVQALSKQFGDTPVLRDLDLTIADGEFAVIVGPSGCGKSTLLRLIAGIDTVTSGAILIGERDVARVHPGRRDVAMVFQDYALYPHMTVEKNLSFGLRARRVGTKQSNAARVREVATSLQIEGLLHRKPAQLSGGQRQRVALGRAMIREPQVYLMDEPLSNLDAALRVQVREDLIEFHRTTGGTIVYVTHDQIEAMTMGERVVVMNDGVIQQSGPPAEIYDRPVNTFVATFVGSPRMNMVEGIAVREDAGVSVTARDLTWRFDPGLELPDEVIVGFRPEAIVLADTAPDIRATSADAVVKRTVDFVEHIGHEALLRLGSGDDRLLARVDSATGRLELGEAEYMIARRNVHVFDAASGQAIAHGGRAVVAVP